MAQAKIYWDLGDYQQVEKVFRKSVEFCSEHDVWKLNVAHVLFMQVGVFTVFLFFMLTDDFHIRKQNSKKQQVSTRLLSKRIMTMLVYYINEVCVDLYSKYLPSNQLLGISAIVLANLCVSYIMTSHTEEVIA